MPIEKPRTITEWIKSPKTPGPKLQAICKDIRDNLLPLFEYDFLHLADDPSSIKFDPINRQIIFENPYRLNEPDFGKGQCTELATKTYMAIREKYPEAKGRLAYITGTCEPFFGEEGSVHDFLAISDMPMRYKGVYIRDFDHACADSAATGETINISGEVKIIDPSFGLVTAHPDSRYSINQFTTPLNCSPVDGLVLPENKGWMGIKMLGNTTLFNIGFFQGEIIIRMDYANKGESLYFLEDEIDVAVTPQERRILERMFAMRQTIVQAMARS